MKVGYAGWRDSGLINRNSSCLIREGSVLSVKNLVLPSRLHSEWEARGDRGSGPSKSVYNYNSAARN